MESLGPWQGARPAAPCVEAGDVPTVEDGTLVLATWRHLLDRGSLQDGEPFLAGTAPSPVARISAGTAAGLGVTDGDRLTVRVGDTTVTAPVLVCEMADHVVWLPTNSVGSDLRAALAGAPGALSPSRRSARHERHPTVLPTRSVDPPRFAPPDFREVPV